MRGILDEIAASPLAGAAIITAAAVGGWAGFQVATGSPIDPLQAVAVGLPTLVVAYVLRWAVLQN